MEEFPYRNLKLTSNIFMDKHNGRIMKIIKKNSRNIEKLCLHSFSGSLMLPLLKFVSQTLTHLIISSSFPDAEYEGFVDLPKLEYLQLNTIDSFLRVARCENLKTLEIDNCRDGSAFETFMKNSNNLRKLKKLKTFRKFWQLEGIDDFLFELRELELIKIKQIDIHKVHKFLLSQAMSLKKLSITESLIQASTINFVLDILPKLDTLGIYGSIYCAAPNDMKSYPENRSLKTLEIFLNRPHIPTANINEADDIEKILKKCGILKNLHLRGTMSTNREYEGRISIPTLKSLSVGDLSQIGFWDSIDVNNVENFTIEVLNSLPEHVDLLLDILPCFPILKNLQVNDWLYFDTRSSIMRPSDMREFSILLMKYETFRIKRCEVMPSRFLRYLKKLRSETFKLFEFVYEDDFQYQKAAQRDFKYAKFQTIFREFEEEKLHGIWEKDVENFEEADNEQGLNGRIRMSFRSFMSSSLYPDF